LPLQAEGAIDEVWRELEAAALASGLGAAEVRGTLNSALRKARELGPAVLPARPLLRANGAAAHVDDAPEPTEDGAIQTEIPGEPLPVVRLGLDADRVVRETIDAISHAPNVFTRAGVLVRIVRDIDGDADAVQRDAEAPVIRPCSAPTLELTLSTRARFERFDERSKQWQPCAPTKKLLSMLIDVGIYPGIRRLEGIASSPILRADGSIAQEPGYDEPSGFFLAFNRERMPRIPDAPSRDDAIAARDRLLDLVQDFPFAGDEHRASWLALLVTLIARPAIGGPVPLFAITANVRGCGKSRLVDLAAIIATGRAAPRAVQPYDDGESRKILTSIVLGGDALVLFDNFESHRQGRDSDVECSFGGAAIDAFLTGDRWKDRLLGTNTTIDLPIKTVIAVTGNNLPLLGDTIRRALFVRLDSPYENPEDRTDFAIPNLPSYVRDHRYELVRDALVIARAWYAAGQPRARVRAWGSFEVWSSIVPEMIVWVGLPDPQETRARDTDTDDRLRALTVIIEHWPRLEKSCAATQGLTIRAALGLLYPGGQPRQGDGLDDLRWAIEVLAPGRGTARVDAHGLGNVFRRYANRVVAGRRLVPLCAAGHPKVARWGVR
jgi:putative DNA primase/helicase